MKDLKTELLWKTGPDRDTNWNEAKSWVQSLSLDGGGWRMPTMDELEGLYEAGAGDRNMILLLKTKARYVWSNESAGPDKAMAFSFDDGYRRWGYHVNPLKQTGFSGAFPKRGQNQKV